MAPYCIGHFFFEDALMGVTYASWDVLMQVKHPKVYFMMHDDLLEVVEAPKEDV